MNEAGEKNPLFFRADLPIRTRVLVYLVAQIFLINAFITILGYVVISRYFSSQIQESINNDLASADAVYLQESNGLKNLFSAVGNDYGHLKKAARLDYLEMVPVDRIKDHPSELVRLAVESGKILSSTSLLSSQQAKKYGIYQPVNIVPTPHAGPANKDNLEDVMAIECARPFVNSDGKVLSVLYGGRRINYNLEFIDNIVSAVFHEDSQDGRPYGTVTIFQDDVRIATNVPDRSGQRALGTRISREVYERVVKNGLTWQDRAFVVTDWYITAYKPVKDISDRVIGVLYVGILEAPFASARRNMLLLLFLIVAVTTLIAAIVSGRSMKDIGQLADCYSRTAKELEKEQETLKSVNKQYLELIGFVSHELKGVLACVMMNGAILQKEIPGKLTQAQKDVVCAIMRNLDYLSLTVNNFLNLSRIEKEGIVVDKKEINLKEHVISPAVDAFARQAKDKKISIIDDFKEEITVYADPGLLQIVFNNLISNALKYGKKEGYIRISSEKNGDSLTVSVYNDGQPLTQAESDRLFKAFSRIVRKGTEKEKGTGIGLFISKQIINKHGGDLKYRAHESGSEFYFDLKTAEEYNPGRQQ